MSSSDTNPYSPGTLARIAGWCFRHRWIVIAAWIVALVASLALARAAGTHYATNASLAGSDSQRASDLLSANFAAKAGDTDQIVLHSRTGRVTDPAVRARAVPVLRRIARLPHVTAVASPFTPAGAGAVSRDGTIAFATVSFDQRAADLPDAAVRRVIAVAESARSPGLQVELEGQAVEQSSRAGAGITTAVGLTAAIVILLITFGSLVAMGLPIATALLGLGIGIALIGLGSHVLDMPDFAIELSAMIGLGVGIDYALFIVTRFREFSHQGADVRTATVAAMDTAGRAVLFAGCTVIIALLGMFALGIGFLQGLAIAASLAVLLTMGASLTVLPALLSWAGPRVARRRRERTAPEPVGPGAAHSGFWQRWSRLVQRHPWPAAVAGLVILLAFCAPALSLRLGSSDAGNDPAGHTTRKAYDLLARGFGKGFNGPLRVAVALPRAGDRAALAPVTRATAATPGVASVTAPQLSPNGRVATFNVYPSSSPQAAATNDLVNRLRDRVFPPLARRTGTGLHVGGVTAVFIDFSAVLSAKLPIFIGIVVLLSALLLLVVFRSLVIPVQAALMNLLSIGASLGIVVAVFQWGWLGVKEGPIESFVPVMLFAIVFGLSMDYEVFLISRIREEWDRRQDASQSVAEGVASTGRVITAAATIMVCVFASFILGGERVIMLFGVSLSTAVFLDAFVVRSLLLPSVLELIGRWTWSLPRWLERGLPRLHIEGEDLPVPAAAAQGSAPHHGYPASTSSTTGSSAPAERPTSSRTV